MRKIIESRLVDNYEAAKILKEKLGSEGGQQNPIVARTEEFLSQVATKCDYEKSREVLNELMEIGINRETAIMLLNTLPTEEAEIRALLPPESQTLPLESTKKIAEILSKCQSK
ncbi:MAG: hypothetical protein ACP5LZ_06480 [Fervidicoccaceae archaeon]